MMVMMKTNVLCRVTLRYWYTYICSLRPSSVFMSWGEILNWEKGKYSL